MSTDTTATEKKDENIATQPEKVESQTSTEVDYESVIAQQDAELKQVRTERENYRKAYLKNGGKKPVESSGDEEDETMDTIIDRKVQEKFLSTQEAQIQAKKDATISALAKRNKELEIALKNRGQITSTSAQGSNQEKPEGKTDSYFSNDQVQALKAKGWSDKKIEEAKKNMIRGTSGPKI